MKEKYYIGLDMGTSSVGWAATDENYQLVRKKGKDLWGVRLFDEAETAASRRAQRTAKRRQRRQRARIGYLKEYFAEEINKVDPGFFQRLEDSKYFAEDKVIHQPFALFSDTKYTDVEYFKQYPTIFHLRKELIENKEPHDVRLVYLAILNMYKHRGHFLNANLEGGSVGDLKEYYNELKDMVNSILDIEFPELASGQKLEEILASKNYSKSKKVELVLQQLGIIKSKEKMKVEIWKMICGLKGTISTIFTNESYDEESRKFSISFEDTNFDEACEKVEELLEEDSYELFLLMKNIHDWGVLANIMKGENGTYKYLSQARVDSYEKHGKDLGILKKLYKQCAPYQYDEMFRVMAENNYSSYVGSVNSGKEVERRGASNKPEDFFRKIKKELTSFPESDEKKYVLEEIDKGTFLPKQLTSSNGVIPNQLHKAELKAILDNAEMYLGFLKEKDASGLSVSERIIQLFEFQIPYYIGPITPFTMKGQNYSKNIWSVRNEGGAVLPWNFEQKIDVKMSAENFISRMVNHCTYLSGENVLSKNSLLYEKFMVLNELNNLRINGEKIPVKLKQDIFEELLKSEKRITVKNLESYLKAKAIIGAKDIPDISGIDGGFANRRANYVKFAKIMGVDTLTYEQERMAEDIIFWATVYGDTKKFLSEKIREHYDSVLTKEQLKRVLGLKFKDWGRLSKGLLEIEGMDKHSGEVSTVIQKMWNGNYNLMELIESNQFTYREEIEKRTSKMEKDLLEITHDDLEKLYISVPVRRMVWQTILILKEIYRVMGCGPQRIFVEMARESHTSDKRTVSRKKKFADLYKKCREEERDWSKEIENTEETQFHSKKLYLYYTQKGRCMYTGDRIELKDLFNDNLYDIDHIYPRHFVKDDSLENNLVLVKKEINAHKSDSYPLEPELRQRQKGLWKELRDGGFITEEKYKRLTRNSEFTDDERVQFINRQLVETRQGTKVITELFKQTFPESEIVYVKSGNVSDFRQKYKFVKCRNVNDHHHAKDAYLNIVVGNVYYVKFTKNPYNFIVDCKKHPERNPYHMNKIFDYKVERNGEIAWDVGKSNSIRIVQKMMEKNTPMITMRNYEAHGGLADQTIYSADKASKVKGVGYAPVKSLDSRLEDVCRYGGYTKMTGAYFFLLEHTKNGKRIRSLEAMPLYLKEQLNTKEKLEDYCCEKLQYTEPDVRVMKIKMYSLIRVNGFYLYLTGRSGSQLLVCNAVQLVLDDEKIKYVKEITKVRERGYTEEQLESHKIISREKNMEMYEILAEKHGSTIYKKRPNPIGDKLNEWKKDYASLNLERQIYILLQIIQLSQLVNQGADLRDIGGAKATGISLLNKIVSNCKEFKLINQSVTGLYENEIDLLTI